MISGGNGSYHIISHFLQVVALYIASSLGSDFVAIMVIGGCAPLVPEGCKKRCIGVSSAHLSISLVDGRPFCTGKSGYREAWIYFKQQEDSSVPLWELRCQYHQLTDKAKDEWRQLVDDFDRRHRKRGCETLTDEYMKNIKRCRVLGRA